jgi:dUTP pyrophosphatase
VSIVNAPGTVDAGYRGEIKVMLVNLDPNEPVQLLRGDRIAQLVFQAVEQAVLTEVDRLPGSARGAGGYGSTGGFTAANRSG